MIIESISAGAAIIYFLSWLTGVIEGFLFRRYIRKSFPSIAEEYFPGMLQTSISKQWKAIFWLKRRGYTEYGNSELNQRADFHRKTTCIVLGAMIVTLSTLVLMSVSYYNASSKNSSNTPAENQSATP
jgi:hypothetical protein